MRTALILAAALVVCGAAAGGTFPGRNGLVVVSRTTSSDPQPALVAIDPATGSQQPLGAGNAGAWSPDGTRLAFVRDGTVFVSAADGGGATAVGPGETPAWSPDGTKLVVSRYDGKVRPDHPRGTLQLVVLDLGGGPPLQLTDAPSDVTLPAWSPDGATIAFSHAGGLGTIAAAGGAAAPLDVPGVTVDGGPAWSPDGRLLAFLDSGNNVWTSAPDGAGARQLTFGIVPPTSATARPAWSPDGTAIAFASGADLCATDLAGNVRRVTRTPQSTTSVIAALPDWQPTGAGSGALFSAPPGAADTIGCDWNPGARVEILDANVSPGSVAVAAPKELVFVNHLDRAVTLTSTLRGGHASIPRGGYVGFSTEPGEYTFTVTGYADGVPRHGSVLVTSTGSVTLEQHAALRYGAATVLTGAARGPGGMVTVTAQPHGSSRAVQVAAIRPAGGRWRLTVAPRVTTRYRVSFAGATAERLLRVVPGLHVRRNGRTARVTVAPARQLAGKVLFLFRSAGRGWKEYRTARIGRTGAALFGGLPPGRYYVGFEGGEAYWAAATEPFAVRS